jgi:hypothetical protein
MEMYGNHHVKDIRFTNRKCCGLFLCLSLNVSPEQYGCIAVLHMSDGFIWQPRAQALSKASAQVKRAVKARVLLMHGSRSFHLLWLVNVF